MIRVQWRENGQTHSAWRDDATLAQKLVVALQARDESITKTRSIDLLIAEMHRLRGIEANVSSRLSMCETDKFIPTTRCALNLQWEHCHEKLSVSLEEGLSVPIAEILEALRVVLVKRLESVRNEIDVVSKRLEGFVGVANGN